MGRVVRWLAEIAIPPMRQLPRDLWRFEVDVEPVADLSTPERLARVKLETADPQPSTVAGLPERG